MCSSTIKRVNHISSRRWNRSYAFFCPSLRVYHVYHANVPMMNNAPPMTKIFMLLLV
jgi:hypothetical protein